MLELPLSRNSFDDAHGRIGRHYLCESEARFLEQFAVLLLSAFLSPRYREHHHIRQLARMGSGTSGISANSD